MATRPWTAALFVSVVTLLSLVPVGLVRADDRTAFLIERLKSDDFRVRGQAALQLGRSNDDAAVTPLCGALADDSDFVRNAAAAGLKRLARPAALPCLRSRLAVESNDAAKTQIQQTIDALNAGASNGGGGGNGGGAAQNPNAKYYIALSKVTNNTGRPNPEIEAVIVRAIQDKLASLGNYQLAPTGETPDSARSVMAGRHMKGYYFSILVERFDYSGGNLKVKVKLAIFSYPGKDLRGEVPVSPVQSGVSPGDKSSEDNLMQLAAGHAVELFAQSFP